MFQCKYSREFLNAVNQIGNCNFVRRDVFIMPPDSFHKLVTIDKARNQTALQNNRTIFTIKKISLYLDVRFIVTKENIG